MSGANEGQLDVLVMLCPDCGKPLKPKKSWGGLPACYCRWNGRKPSMAALEREADKAQREGEQEQRKESICTVCAGNGTSLLSLATLGVLLPCGTCNGSGKIIEHNTKLKCGNSREGVQNED